MQKNLYHLKILLFMFKTDTDWYIVYCKGHTNVQVLIYNHGSHMYSKASNVLEYNYAVRVPSNVLEWYPMFSMFSKTKIMKKPILFVIFVSVW